MKKFKYIATSAFMACCTLCMGIALVWSVMANCNAYEGQSIIAAIIVSLMGGSITIVSLSLLLGYIKEGES